MGLELLEIGAAASVRRKEARDDADFALSLCAGLHVEFA